MYKKKLMKLILILVFVVIVVEIVAFTSNRNTDEAASNSKKVLYFYRDKESYKVTENYDEITDKSTLVNYYQCRKVHCVPSMASQQFYYKPFQNDNLMLFEYDESDSYYVFFNLKDGIKGIYENPAWLLDNQQFMNSGNYIFLKNRKSKHYGIIDKDGTVVKKFTLDELDAYVPTGLNPSIYSIKNDLLITRRNGKYGIERITSDDVVVNYVYAESMRLTKNDKYYKVKSHNKWYLYSFEDQKKHIEEGYDEIIAITDNILIVKKDNALYFENYDGYRLSDEKIDDVSEYYFEKSYNLDAPSIGVEINADNLIIYLQKHENIGWSTRIYEYDTSRNILTKRSGE